MRIGVDLMGSDRSPQALVEAIFQSADYIGFPHTIVVLGTPDLHDSLYIERSKKSTHRPARIEFFPVHEVIGLRDEPVQAVRKKKGSSLVQGVRLLKKRKIDAFVSAGNTGALIAAVTLSLPLLSGVRRPALLVALPTETGQVAVVDVGGNVLCKAHHLVQFAHLGAAFQRCHQGIECPRVGLLNIGVESKKGTKEVQEAYRMLSENKESRMNFVGNIEGRDIFTGQVDVLVTDGFTGNVLLKSSEGIASFIFNFLKQHSTHKSMHNALNNVHRYFNYAEYPGAIVCGVEGIVIKCHGDSDPLALFNSIKGAHTLLQRHFVDLMKAEI